MHGFAAEALKLFESNDLLSLGAEAGAIRSRLHPEAVVGYGLEYQSGTGLSAAGASFSGMVRLEDDLLAGRMLGWFERKLQEAAEQFPNAAPVGLATEAIQALGRNAGVSIDEIMVRLVGAGLRGFAAEDGLKLWASDDDVERWLDVHRAAHAAGLGTVARVVFGGGEPSALRFATLERIHAAQEETGGFCAVAPVGTAPGLNAEVPTAIEALKMLAVTRVCLSNIKHVEASWPEQSLKVLQMALRFGADDAGVLRIREGSIGDRNVPTEEDLRRVIRDAGWKPVERNCGYTATALL